MVEVSIKITEDGSNLETIYKILELIKNKEEVEEKRTKTGVEKEESALDTEDIEELKRRAKIEFIKLARKDKEKAQEFLNMHKVDKFSDLEKVLKTNEDWTKFIEDITIECQ